MKSKRTKACEFTPKVREEIYERDGGECIFCRELGQPEDFFDRQIDGIMHYVARSQGGLGIAKNGALGCHYHHRLLDNGADSSRREEMKEIFENYLSNLYPDWSREDLVYSKWA